MVPSSLTFVDWLFYAGSGILLIFLWRRFPLSAKIGKRWPILQELFDCNLCLGVWFYWILALLLKIRLIDTNIPILGEFLLGTLTSFLAWVFVMGWNSLFRTMLIEGD